MRDLQAQRWNILFVFLELWLNTDTFCALLIWRLGIDQAVIPFDSMYSEWLRIGGDILADGGKYQALFVVEDWDYFGSLRIGKETWTLELIPVKFSGMFVVWVLAFETFVE